MMRRAAGIVGLLGILATGIGTGFLVWHSKIEIVIRKQELQSRVDARLPFRGVREPVRYTVSRVALDLRPDGRIAADADVSAEAFNLSTASRLRGSGELAYEGGSLFLRGFKLEDVTLSRGPQPDKAPGRMAELARRAGEHMQAGDRAGRLLTSAELGAERAVRESGGPILSAVLERVPVYTLKQADYRQRLAKLVLSKLTIRDGDMIVTLDILSALTRILSWLAVAVAACLSAAALLFLPFTARSS